MADFDLCTNTKSLSFDFNLAQLTQNNFFKKTKFYLKVRNYLLF